MGRIVDLCAEVAEAADEGSDGLVLSPEDWERLSELFTEDEIEDALSLVRESLAQSELVDAADSLSARLLELLGAFGGADEFARAEKGEARLTIDAIAQLARRVERLEEVLSPLRDDAPRQRKGFDALQLKLANRGIEDEMAGEQPEPGEDDAGEDEE
jgi:hypothetical protein